jgi:hypothetical protein
VARSEVVGEDDVTDETQPSRDEDPPSK